MGNRSEGLMRRRGATVVLGAVCALALLGAGTASAGTISGTVSEAEGAHATLPGVEVCSHVIPYTFEDSCTVTGAGGAWSLGLPAGTYAIHFRDWAQNRNLVDQYYSGQRFYPGTTVAVPASGAVGGIDANLAPGSTITGTVTDAATAAPVGEIPVCALAEYAEGFAERCERSGPNGVYTINGLPPGEFEVEFQSGYTNYQPQVYDGVESRSERTPVTIAAAGETKGTIDAAMALGVEITGTLRESTGAPVAAVQVEASLPHATGLRQEQFLAHTDINGNYAFRGLPAGEYLVAFSKPQGPWDGDCFSTQFYAGSLTEAGAMLLHGVPGVPLTGIDGEVVRECAPPAPEPASAVVPAPPARSLIAPNPRPKPHPCAKGKHRAQVHGGAARCVANRARKHRAHRHHG
jgi:hypothetical protein